MIEIYIIDHLIIAKNKIHHLLTFLDIILSYCTVVYKYIIEGECENSERTILPLQ